jgi:hypothetical protein
MNYNIPDIYNDSYSSKKNNLEIINLIDGNINNFSKENISLKVTEYELFNINDENKHIIIIKTNYNKDFALETDIGLFNGYNNRIYFSKLKERITFTIYNDDKTNIQLDNSYYKQSILSLYNYTINKYKYNIFSKDDAELSQYGTLFTQTYKNNRSYLYFTFTINITYTNIKEIENIPKLIKIQSQEYIFVYETQLNPNNMIVLYLIAIKNINTDENITINIKFTNIEKIYQKYEIAIDQIKTFLFDKDIKKIKFNKNNITRYIKGKIYLDVIYISL